MKTIAFLIKPPTFGFFSTGEYNGYVAVPPEHPLFGKGVRQSEVGALNVHGGVTFAGQVKDLTDASVNIDLKEPPRNWWAFGFDTCHYDDTPEKWNLERCSKETRKLQKQIEELFAQSK